MNDSERFDIIIKELTALQERVFGMEVANQLLFDTLFSNNHNAKEQAIQILETLISESKTEKQDAIHLGLKKALQHLRHGKPPSPEEMRKKFFVVDKKKPLGNK